jgi:hypothetical protein
MSVVPVGVDRAELRVWVVAAPTAPVGVDQDRYDRRLDTGVEHFAAIANEDVEVLGRLEATRSSLGYRQNRFGLLEARLSWFHHGLNRYLADGAQEQPAQ